MTAIARTKQVNGWRIGRWSAAAALLCVPAIAMRFTGEVDWSANDFAVMGALLAAILGVYDLLASHAQTMIGRAAAALTTLGLFLLIWINLAVGLIGHEGNPANLMFAGVIAILTGGAFIACFEPGGMARTLFIAATAQLIIGVIALAGDLGAEGPGWPGDVIALTIFFTGLWAVAGMLFKLAGERR